MRYISIVIDNSIIFVIIALIIGVIEDKFIITYIYPLLPLFLIGMMLSAGLMVPIYKFKYTNLKRLLIIIHAQYILSTLTAYMLSLIFYNDMRELALGQILHASMPSEQTLPVWIKVANGNLVLGITTLIVSTMLSPFISPPLVYIFSEHWIRIDYHSIFIFLITIVLLPIISGSILRTKISYIAKHDNIYTFTSILCALPTIMIISSLISIFLKVSLQLIIITVIVSTLHLIITLLLGFIIPKVLKWDKNDLIVSVYNLSMKEFSVTLSIIVNAGLVNDVGLPASLYGIMHMSIAPLLARVFRKRYFY